MHSYTSFKSIISFCLCSFLLAINSEAQQVRENILSVTNTKQAASFPLVAAGKAPVIYVDAKDAKVVSIAAQALSEDIKAVTGATPVVDSIKVTQPYAVIIGTIGNSKFIDELIKSKKLNVSKIKGEWERFTIAVINQPFKNVKQALVIAGSDRRGTAFGVFELSRMMGVSPFYWWADVVPAHQNVLFVKGSITSESPSVKFRGIFINDEDWGLQPWAAKTFEPETGDIGPKTYAKVFELLLRLKANLIWPAMHPSTKAFYHYPLNKKVADDYAIVIGSSHAEPMLRNNVDEWNEKTMGHFNYLTNKDMVYRYWEDRVKEVGRQDVMFTLGMRGVHDSWMEGVKNAKEAVPVLQQIFEDQRQLLTKYQHKPITSIPQVFTAYKEVLEIYDSGLKLPGDVTLVWPDDNYGYIQRLNDEQEKKRPGGSGVYYHASYWGRPHDYLWLSSTHPSLIREEMMKAFNNGTNRLWVLNVGDIKPLEYNIQLFMDMAYNAKPFQKSDAVKKHLLKWSTDIFGPSNAKTISEAMWRYYDLAFERKPEFMGWSQTEPTTKTTYTAYNHFYYGDEAQRRIDKYEALQNEVTTLRSQIKHTSSDAYYQLVYYPIVNAALMNKKFLYRDKSYLYARQNRLSAFDYARWSKQAYDSIVNETNYYNNVLAIGKWKNVISMKPRDLPVYQEPVLAEVKIDKSKKWGVAPEGYVTKDSSLVEGDQLVLPTFDRINHQKYFVDLFLSDEDAVSWTATVSKPWIRLNAYKGVLSNEEGRKQVRLWVDVDWNKLPKASSDQGKILFSGDGLQRSVNVNVRGLSAADIPANSFVENNGYVSMNAADFTRTVNKDQHWQRVDGLGYSGKAMRVEVFNKPADTVSQQIINNSSYLEYDFYTFSKSSPVVNIFTLPTHPLNENYSMRYAVSLDGGPIHIIDFRTVGRSEEWKQNVLSNQAQRKIAMPSIEKGKHTLRIHAVDPAVLLDRILIDLGGLKKSYSIIPETKS